MALSQLALSDVLELSLAEIANCDIAELNLCAAHGLPGIDGVDADKWLNRLDEWAYQVRIDICRHIYRLDPRSTAPPTESSYGNSLARFLCWHLLQVLQEDCGVAYHPDRKFNPDFCHPEDLFIHGIVDENGQGGTCASMPVVYVAVAKRLGFPVSLVETKATSSSAGRMTRERFSIGTLRGWPFGCRPIGSTSKVQAKASPITTIRSTSNGLNSGTRRTQRMAAISSR